MVVRVLLGVSVEVFLMVHLMLGTLLSFLGLGAQPPTPEWGSMLNVGRPYMSDAPWITRFPGIAIRVTVLGFNLPRDRLSETLDPRVSQWGGRGARTYVFFASSISFQSAPPFWGRLCVTGPIQPTPLRGRRHGTDRRDAVPAVATAAAIRNPIIQPANGRDPPSSGW